MREREEIKQRETEERKRRDFKEQIKRLQSRNILNPKVGGAGAVAMETLIGFTPSPKSKPRATPTTTPPITTSEQAPPLSTIMTMTPPPTVSNKTTTTINDTSSGEWDWDHYELVPIAQKKNLPVTALATVKYNVWCAIGNTIHVLHSHSLRNEANFTVHSWKNAEVQQLLSVGDGVWVVFKKDSVLRLFNATSFIHMQDLDIAPSVHNILVFGSEKMSNAMPVPVSCVVAAQNSLWIGTENGIILNFPFSRPTIVAEESGWEVIKEAEVGGQSVPEPFDVRTEEAIDASIVLEPQVMSTASQEADAPGRKSVSQSFNPFISIDQVQLSIHCHVNSVKSLVCVPGMVPSDITVFEPLGGVYIGPGDRADYKPSLFVMSCGEGHLDLRTADKVMQTVHAQESGKSGIPSAVSIISEKNYIMVWDVLV